MTRTREDMERTFIIHKRIHIEVARARTHNPPATSTRAALDSDYAQ